MKKRKIRIAILDIPYSHLCPSSDLYFKVDNYLRIKHKNLEFTYFVDEGCSKKFEDSRYAGSKFIKLRGFDNNIRLFKPLNVILKILGLPHYYYPGLIKKLKGFDLIRLTHPEFHIFAIQSYLAARKYNSKYLIHNSATTYHYLFPITKYLIFPFLRKLMKNVSRFMFTNPGAKKRYEDFKFVEKGSNRSIVTGLPVDTDIFKPMKIKKYGGFTLISVGGLYKVKGHQIVIKSIKRVLDKGHNVKLYIYGEGNYENKLRKLVKSLNLEKNVEFKGHVSYEKLAEAYNKSHIFVQANLEEYTSAIAEAMTCNLPVVVMNTRSMRFAIPDESYGMVTRRYDIGDMSEKIIKLLKNKRLREKLSKNGRNHIYKKLGYKYVAERTYKAYIEAYNDK